MSEKLVGNLEKWQCDHTFVGRWFHEPIDQTGDTLADIVAGLRKIELGAAKEFIRLYLGKKVEDEA